jgi:hypothetical protein
MLKEVEFQASSFDRLRMRRSDIDSWNLMVSLSNQGPHPMIVAPECAAA